MDNLPTPYVNINAKFKKDGHVIEKLGFYSSTFKNFVFPADWINFEINGNIEKLPHGISSGNTIRLKPDEIISWQYSNQ